MPVAAENAAGHEGGEDDGDVVACDRDEDDGVEHAVASILVFQAVVASWDTWVREDIRTWATWEQQRPDVRFLLLFAARQPLLLQSAFPWGCTAAIAGIRVEEEVPADLRRVAASFAVPAVVAAAATEKSIADAI